MTSQIATQFKDTLVKKPQESTLNALLHVAFSQEQALCCMGRFRVCDLTRVPNYLVLAVGNTVGELTRTTLEFALEKTFSIEMFKEYVPTKDTKKDLLVRNLLLVALLGFFGYVTKVQWTGKSLVLAGRIVLTGDALAKSFYLTASSQAIGYVVREVYDAASKAIQKRRIEEQQKALKGFFVDKAEPLTASMARTIEAAISAVSSITQKTTSRVPSELARDKEVLETFLNAIRGANFERGFDNDTLQALARVPFFAPYIVACFMNTEIAKELTQSGITLPVVHLGQFKDDQNVKGLYKAAYRSPDASLTFKEAINKMQIKVSESKEKDGASSYISGATLLQVDQA